MMTMMWCRDFVSRLQKNRIKWQFDENKLEDNQSDWFNVFLSYVVSSDYDDDAINW